MRLPDWLPRLRAKVGEWERAPFARGPHACGIFGAECVDAVTGSNWAETIRPGDRRSAARQLLEEGGIEAAVTQRLGPAVPGHNARRGDICQLGPRSLGVCMGATVRAFTKDGLSVLPLARVRQHWRVE